MNTSVSFLKKACFLNKGIPGDRLQRKVQFCRGRRLVWLDRRQNAKGETKMKKLMMVEEAKTDSCCVKKILDFRSDLVSTIFFTL